MLPVLGPADDYALFLLHLLLSLVLLSLYGIEHGLLLLRRYAALLLLSLASCGGTPADDVPEVPDADTQPQEQDTPPEPTPEELAAQEVEDLYNEHGGNPHLDGAYSTAGTGHTVFAQVFEGMENVTALSQVEADASTGVPAQPVVIQSIQIVPFEEGA